MMIISRRLVVEDSASVSPRLERILARFDSVNRVIMAGEMILKRGKLNDRDKFECWYFEVLELWYAKRKGGSILGVANQVIMKADQCDHALRITLVIIGLSLGGVIWYFHFGQLNVYMIIFT